MNLARTAAQSVWTLAGSLWQAAEARASTTPLYRRLAVQRGAASANWVVGVLIVALIAVFLLPIVITHYSDVDTTGWDSGVVGIWGVFIILVVLAIVFGIYKSATSGN